MKANLAVALSVAGLAHVGQANELVLDRTAIAGHERRIAYSVQWKPNCEPWYPKLVVVTPPRHGTLCTRDHVAVTKPDPDRPGEQPCVGRRIKGLVVIYLPAANYSGPDKFGYAVDIPGRIPADVRVNITVTADGAAAASTPDGESIAAAKTGDIIVACAPPTS